MVKIDLRSVFPTMTPIDKPPKLFNLHGTGIGMHGKRDYHESSNTYISTRCLMLFSIPIFALAAYRVESAGARGWYFIGREPLSGPAKWWDRLLVITILSTLGAWGWHVHTHTPEYLARQQMAAARALADKGQLSNAAKGYQALAITANSEASNATAAIRELIDGRCQQAPLEESAGVFAAAAQVARRGKGLPTTEVSDPGLKLALARGDSDPRGGVAVLDAVRPLVLDTRAIDDARFKFLQKWAAADPSNLDVLAPLASMFDERGKVDEAANLLLPVKDKLGEGEGARVLGLVLGRRGDYNGAYALLWPYTKNRLDRLHGVEKESEQTLQSLWLREVNLLKNEKGPPELYKSLETATETQRDSLVRDYINGRLKDDPDYNNAQNALEKETAVVPVALELGIVMLQRAQEISDPEERTEMLHSAEEVFLAIGGIAGESDAYRVSLGQVYYWLGRATEGRKLFEDYLASKNHAVKDMLAIAGRLRMLGAAEEARLMSEKAYNKALTDEDRYEAASLRQLCNKDLDDEIAWLYKCDPSDPYVKASLAKSLGNKALEEGRDDEAVRQYHATIDAYAAMPRNTTTLNEAALAYYGIYFASGDRAAFDRCIDYFQQAVDLSPSDAILLGNAGHTILCGALADIVGSEIDLHALHRTGSIDMLSFLYRDPAGRDVIIKRMQEHPGIARALTYFDKVMVLSPKSGTAYKSAYDVQSFMRNEPELRRLEQRLRAAELDHSRSINDTKDFLAGKTHAKMNVSLPAAIKRDREILAAVQSKGGKTAAVAMLDVVNQMMVMEVVRAGQVDPDEMLKLAEEANRLDESSYARYMLKLVRFYRTHMRLVRSDKTYAAFSQKYVRSLGITHLLCTACDDESMRSLIVKDPDVLVTLDLAKEALKTFPDDRSPYEWALFRHVDPAIASLMAASLKRSTQEPLDQSIDLLLGPAQSTTVLNNHWYFQIQGKTEEARAVMEAFAKYEIATPIQP